MSTQMHPTVRRLMAEALIAGVVAQDHPAYEKLQDAEFRIAMNCIKETINPKSDVLRVVYLDRMMLYLESSIALDQIMEVVGTKGD